MTGGKSKRKWHPRTRAGCLTCRRRRIKCDEKKPICEHCSKGSRDCTYPPDIESKEETLGLPSLSETPSLSARLKVIVGPTRIDPKMVIESLASPSCPIEASFVPPALIMSGLTPTTYSHALQSRHELISITESMLGIPQSISPHGTRSKPVQFFLQYHRTTITEAHYLRWYDYSKLCTVLIFKLAETADVLQNAMVAFSALIYSIKVNPGAREIAFLYYSVSLQELRLLLNKSTLDMTDCYATVASALQLSSFDRFFGDIAKCFQHLKGAASILQQVTNPAQLCSSVIGRSLLEWILQFELYCRLHAPHKLLLPRTWREENVRIRNQLAIVEYPDLPDDERKARILDDVWAEFFLIPPELGELVYKLPKLKTMSIGACAAFAIELRTTLIRSEERLEQFINLPHFLEVLEPAIYSPSHHSKHANCCPPPPFIPYVLQFPPAGILRIVLLAFKCFVQSFLRPAIYKACGLEAELPKLDESYAFEICRTFAGIEDALGDNPDSCLSIFSTLTLAISTCPQELRSWFWYKLAHFEQQGLAIFKNPIRENFAKLWNITDVRYEIKGSPEPISP